MKKILLIVALVLFAGEKVCGGMPSALEVGFEKPPMEAKPRAYWCWVEGNFDLKKLDLELKEAYKKGMGGFDIWNVGAVVDENHIVPKGPSFMGDESVNAIVHCINEASKYGLSLGLVLSSGWNSGGSWTTPEHQTMGLYKSEAVAEGGRKVQVHLPFPKWGDASAIIPLDKNGNPLFFQDIKILAYPLSKDSVIQSVADVIELPNRIDNNNNLTVCLPKGKWRVVRHLCLNTGQAMILNSKSAAGPMIDHLSAEAAEAQIRFFAEKLKKKLGSFEGKALKYFYNDSYEVTGLLWTPTFLDEFKQRIGYDMTPYLPVLYGFKLASKDTLDRFLFDYRKVLSDLIIENHYIKSRKVCESYGLGYVAEAAGPGKPFHNCPFESLRSSGVLSHPRGEFWYNHNKLRSENEIDQLQIVKGVASASHIYNQKIVEAEAFTSTSLWQEAPCDLKSTLDRAFCEGLNRVLFHVFSHSPKSGGSPGYVYAFGTQINTNRTWWNMSEDFMAYIGRTSFMLQQGNFVGDVLYYYGDDAPNFVPTRKQIPSLGFGYDYDYINTDILLNQLTVKNGKLLLPNGQSYEILVLPDCDFTNLDVLVKLERLVSEGAIIIGQKPIKSQGLLDYEQKNQSIKLLGSSMWQNVDGVSVLSAKYGFGRIYKGVSEKEVLSQQSILPDFEPVDTAYIPKLDYIHRTTEGVEIYFVRNTSGHPIRCDALFRVSGKVPEFWNPISGATVKSKLYQTDKTRTLVPLNLEEYGSIFVVFRDTVTQRYITQLNVDGKTYFPKRANVNNLDFNLGYSSRRIYSAQSGNYDVKFSTGKQRKFTIKKDKETILFTAPWQVIFPKKTDTLRTTFDHLYSWTESPNDEIKYFSGTASYSTEFTCPSSELKSGKRVVLNLGEVANIARISVNGQKAGICWVHPFKIDVTSLVKSGVNRLLIEVANLEPNGMIGESRLPVQNRTLTSNVIRLPNAWAYPLKELPNSEFPLLQSGLIGPVRIKFEYLLRDL
ncbi:MAG: glycosyl hydrolase [Bacteroidales bacterium]|nr:glycosyl hydrolase [Bacteroidales bacterium]